jgi:predicted ATPase
MVAVTGEAGIGKTALVDAFMARVAAPAMVWSSRGHCLEHYGPGEAYLPLLEALSHLGRGPDGTQLGAVLRQQAPSWLLQLPALVADAELAGLQRRASGTTRERMLRELAEAVETLTVVRPLMLVLEDLHWSDGSTLDWLAYMARRRGPARFLVLGTYRPAEAITHGHPIHTVTQELLLHGQGHELILEYLPAAAVAAYLVQRFGGRELPEGLAGVLHQRTRGNPLFLVTVVEDLLRHGDVHEEPHRVALPGGLAAVTARLPESLRQMIERHLTQLPRAQQEVLEGASIAGKEFAAAMVAAGLAQDAVVVEAHCATLARQHQFLRACGTAEWPDGTVSTRYAFIHDLYHEVIAARVPVGQRVQWYQRMGSRLEAGYGAQARERAAELAFHFVHGRDVPRAVQYLRYAGENALRRSAYQDAVDHLTTGLQLLPRLPETPERCQQELDMQITLGQVLGCLHGPAAPDVDRAYRRAHALCQQLGAPRQLLPVLLGLGALQNVRGHFHTARRLARQAIRLAERGDDLGSLGTAHGVLGASLSFLGEFAAARTHLEQSLTLDDPCQPRGAAFLLGENLQVFCVARLSSLLWYLGYPDHALQHSQQALTLARALSHPPSVAFALAFAALLHYLRREGPMTQAVAEASIVLAQAQGFALRLAEATALRGGALVLRGQTEDGIRHICQGLAAVRATGTAVQPYRLAMLAAAYGQGGQGEAGLQVLTEALAIVKTTAERRWAAELSRLKGELLLGKSPDNQAAANSCFQQALAIARRQQAKSWELRAAVSLARLWQQQGKQAEAHELLAPLYGWFTEGFDTADLQEAKVLLDELGG